ncbi:MAG: flhB [Bacilli bacterium]|nr:flhB [Bacilli bacterium]
MILLNLQLFAGEKSELATAKKRQEAREKGQIVKSAELSSALTFLAAVGVLKIGSSYFTSSFLSVMKGAFTTQLSVQLTPANVHQLFGRVILQITMIVLPIMAAILIAGVASNALQTRGLITLHPLLPDLDRINPLKGFSRIFSLRSLVELVKSLLKLTIVGLVIYTSLNSQVQNFDQLLNMEPIAILNSIGSMIFSILWKVCLCLLALGLFDYFYQRFDYEKNLKMSKQEIKDEYKTTEGNPLIKNKIKEKQRALAMRRMMQDVPKADVVITNPTHFAIAIKYDVGKMDAPIVVAKGRNDVALRIKELAREHGIVQVENRPLAQSLYRLVEIGEQVPAEFFQAVAEVLAYVYRIKRRS